MPTARPPRVATTRFQKALTSNDISGTKRLADLREARIEHVRRTGQAHAEVAGRFEEVTRGDRDAMLFEQTAHQCVSVRVSRQSRKHDRRRRCTRELQSGLVIEELPRVREV